MTKGCDLCGAGMHDGKIITDGNKYIKWRICRWCYDTSFAVKLKKNSNTNTCQSCDSKSMIEKFFITDDTNSKEGIMFCGSCFLHNLTEPISILLFQTSITRMLR